jgi:O-antigen/teichoic acid export membrane protein
VTGEAPSVPRIGQNTLFSAVSEGSNLLLFLLGFLAARWLGPVDFGGYAAALAFVGLFRILPDFGMAYASTLEISRDRSLAGRLIGGLLGLQGVLSLVTVIACLALGSLIFQGGVRTAALLLSLDLVFKSLKATLRWLLKGLERFGVEALSLLLERGLLLAVCSAVLRAGGGLLGFVVAFTGIRVLDASGLFGYIHARVVRLRPAVDRPLWRELFRKGLPFAYAGAAITLFSQLNQVLLEQMRGAAEAGFFAAPARLVEGFTLVPRILSYALIPTMAALFPTDPGAVTRLYARGVKYLLVLGLPVALVGLLASPELMRLLFGAEYAASAAASRILLPATAFMFLSNFGETTLACISRWRSIVIIATFCLVLNVALNLLLIPRLGYVGAAWATLLTETSYFALGAAALALHGHPIDWRRVGWRPFAAAGVSGLVFLLAQPAGFGVATGGAAVMYVLATLGLRVFDAQEFALARALARNPLGLSGKTGT